MGIDDKDLDGFLGEAFKAGPEESALEAIERLHGAGSSVLLRDSDADASPVLLRRDADGVADDPRYHVLGEIARGGIGVVYKGRDKDLNREVALKVLRPELADRADVIQRFIEEAQVGGQLQHPGIVPVYGLGVQKDGRPSFAMKLIKGNTLAELLATNPRGIDLLTVFEQIAQTMAYAHSRGVIHRDLKPANVMVGAFGEVQVVDWGFAKVLGQEDLAPRPDHTVIATVRSGEEGSQSIAGSVMGTPAYMPPEQALGQIDELDEASDVFALGAILCEILTGQPPYIGSQKDQLIAASQCLLDPARERLDEADAPEELRQIVRDCLQPLSADRPRDVADRLADFFAQAEERARQAELDAVTSETNAAREQHAKRRSLVLAGAALLLIVAGASGYLWSWLERTGREERALPRVAAALREAKGFEGERDWTAAVAAATKAVDIAASEGVTDGGARELLVSLERQRDAADEAARLDAADTTLLAELERARALEWEHDGVKAKDDAFTAAVRKRWPDLQVDTERLTGNSLAQAFAAAFDDWAQFRKSNLEDQNWQSIDAWARAIDPEHNRLRDILAAEDAAALEKALGDEELNSLPVSMISSIGSVLTATGREKQAVSFLQRAARLHPGDYWIHVKLGDAADKARERELAVRHWQAALAIRPQSVEAHHWLGIMLERSGDLDGALAMWREGLAIRPEWGHALTHIAPALATQGKSKEALAMFVEAIRRTPSNYDVHYAHGRFLRDTMIQHDRALESFDRAIEIDPGRVRAYDSRAATLLKMRDPDAAEAALEKALEADPEDRTAQVRMGDVLLFKKEYERADAHFSGLLERYPDDPQLLHALGGLECGRGNYDEAIRLCRKANRLDPDVGHNYLGLALIEKHKGRPPSDKTWDEVLAVCRKAAELRPDEASSHNNLALTHMYRHEFKQAIPLLQKALELDPRGPSAYGNLGNVYVRIGRPDKAVGLLRKSVKLDPNRAIVRVQLGDALARTGKFEDAEREYRAGVRLRPRDWRFWQSLAQTLPANGDLEGALEAWREVASLGGGYRTRVGAFLCDEMRRYDDAIAEFRRVLEKHPDDAYAQSNIAVALRNKRQWAEAVEAARKAVQMAPDQAPLQHTLGDVLMRSGDLDGAGEAFKRALKIDATHRAARRQLGWVVQMRILEKRLAERDQFTPQEKAMAASLLLFRQRFEESARLFRAAFNEDPSLAAPLNAFDDRAIRAAARAGGIWHEQALPWARSFYAWRKGNTSRYGTIKDVRIWQAEPDFASIRDADDLSDDWKKFWADMDALKRSREAKK